MDKIEDFLQPMKPFPGLESFVRTIFLSELGIELFYYEAGSPDLPPALLIHGLGDEADTWRHLISPLSSRWRIIALDLPGFGRSAKPKTVYNEGFLVYALERLLDALKIRAAVMIGHSLGGALAHRIALDQPERVSGLVLLSGSLLMRPQGASLQTLLFLIPGIGEFLYNRLRKDPLSAYESLRLYYSDLDSLPEIDREFLYLRVNQRVWSDDQRRAYFSTLRQMAAGAARPHRDFKEHLARVDLPTLVLWGDQDRIYSPESGRELSRLQPDTRMVLLPRLGHNAHQEDPEAVLRLILADSRLGA